MATEIERDIFAETILTSVGKNATKIPEYNVSGFLSSKGSNYDYELMVVGRAVNGWIKGIDPAELIDVHARKKYAEEVYKSVNGESGCPMEWVMEQWGTGLTDYNTKRSAFWRVIRALVGQFSGIDENSHNWPSHLVWSNLYKVAPSDGGNPSERLCEVQLDGCKSLLGSEIHTYRPKHLLFLTGLDWIEPFLQDFSKNYRSVSDSFVEDMGTMDMGPDASAKVVIAAHPQGKDESQWVRQVFRAFSSL